MRTELSIAFQADRRPADYVALAQLVDGYAFDRVSVYNDLFYQPSLGPLLWMAPHLRRARLGPAALNPYLVHPVELAGQAALLDLASNGRAYLGLTRGAWLGTVGVSTERPLTALHEAVLIIRALLEGRAEGVAGRVYRLAPGARLRYAPLRGAVPIVLGTWGRATARLAGALADEIKVGGSANPAMVSHLAPSVAAGMASAARSADSVGICLGTVTVVDSDRELARARARQALALYLPVVAPLDPTIADRDWLARLQTLAARDDAEGIAGLITDEVLDRFALAGDPAGIVAQVETLLAAGATRVEFGTPHGVADAATGIRLLGEQVLPNVQR